MPQKQGTMGTTPDEIARVMTFNILATAVVTPMTGWFVSRFERRRVMTASIRGFTLATRACGAADLLETLLLWRIVQGGAGAPVIPLSQAVLPGSFLRGQAGRATSVFGMAVVIGPVLGAACPARGIGATIVVPEANINAMNEHLAQIGRNVSAGAIALLVLEGAGWHRSKYTAVGNIFSWFEPPGEPRNGGRGLLAAFWIMNVGATKCARTGQIGLCICDCGASPAKAWAPIRCLGLSTVEPDERAAQSLHATPPGVIAPAAAPPYAVVPSPLRQIGESGYNLKHRPKPTKKLAFRIVEFGYKITGVAMGETVWKRLAEKGLNLFGQIIVFA